MGVAPEVEDVANVTGTTVSEGCTDGKIDFTCGRRTLLYRGSSVKNGAHFTEGKESRKVGKTSLDMLHFIFVPHLVMANPQATYLVTT